MTQPHMYLGAIADDLTGATDLALTLSNGGLRVMLTVGIPTDSRPLRDAEAVVVALKSRTIPVDEAVRQAIAAAQVLRDAGARQIFFKYCSTFDSTDAGNIGPVTDALMHFLGTDNTIACPAFPDNSRTVYMGHLFLGDRLLSESSMKDHPLTPMRDANLVRVLEQQSCNTIRLVAHPTVNQGGVALRQAFEAGRGIAVVDAISNDDLIRIGQAARGMPLITGGSGVALGLPENFGAVRRTQEDGPPVGVPGRAVVLAGSCSAATRAQVEHAISAGLPAFRVDPIAVAEKRLSSQQVIDFATRSTDPSEIPVVYSSAAPEDVAVVHDRIGREQAGTTVERFLGEVACGLRAEGFSRFLIAGGETSGAVMDALDIQSLEIGREIDPGVAWCFSPPSSPNVALALKSGNFGQTDIFTKAWELLR